jgi:hypothetical protein
MSYRHDRELARLRHELRRRLLTHRPDGIDLVLARFRTALETNAAKLPELRGEYERWKTRFELLASN